MYVTHLHTVIFQCKEFPMCMFLLVGYDLISQFQLDQAASRGIIQRVVGSTPLQVAYKLGINVDFRIPTR